VILVFVGLVLIGDTFTVLIAAAAERFSQTVSLAVFFGLFGLVFVVSWLLAVRITERFLIRSN